MYEIFNYSNPIINRVSLDFKRYLFQEINWDARLIEILGGRGVGKTTLMLQRAKMLNSQIPNQAVYLSLDDMLMYRNSIVGLAEELEKYGVRYLFLDEVHKYPSKLKDYDWSAEIKNAYDRFPGLNIVYSGSSVLKIYKGQGDLSRRKSSWRMAGLSFREHLAYNKILNAESILLDDIISNHQDISKSLTEETKIIPAFKTYLATGYFPFYAEDPGAYNERLGSIINVIIETDIPAVSEISFDTSQKLKKLLAAIASSVPYVPNLLKLRGELYISDQRTLLKYLDLLEKAEVISILSQQARGNKIMHKPDKVYLGNTNYYYALQFQDLEIGTVRETFFESQLSVNHQLRLPPSGDFLVDDKYVFEIGGRNKTMAQVKGTDSTFLAVDDIENGVQQTIPLWLFGFLY
jgi:uncharacterized protein